MPARIVGLCDAIVSYLNGLTLSQTFTAVRQNVWYEDEADSDDLRIIIVPQESETVESTRASSIRRMRVNVIVEQRLIGAPDATITENLLQLMDEIEDSLYMVNQAQWGWDAFSETIGSRQFVDVDGHATERVFRVVLQVTYLGN